MPLVHPNDFSILYADDTTLAITDQNKNTLYTRATNLFRLIADWFNTNGLTLDVKKTDFIIFTSPRYKGQLPDQLLFDNNVV